MAPVHALSIVTTVAEGLPMTALAIKFLMDLARLVAQEACEIFIAAARADIIICCHLSVVSLRGTSQLLFVTTHEDKLTEVSSPSSTSTTPLRLREAL